MSDYLSRIVERAGSAAMAVRPLLPSLFEPVKAGGVFDAVPTSRGSEPKFGTEHDLQPAGEADNQSRSIHDRVASIQSNLATSFASAAPQKSEAATKRTSADLVSSPLSATAGRAFAAESHAVAAPTAESPHKKPAAMPRTIQSSELARRQPMVEDAKPASHPLVNAEPTPVILRAMQGLATAVPAAPLLIPAVEPVPRAPIVSRARTNTAFVTPADSSPAPAIHVTIGRVEVRAILPTVQATQPPARSAPKLSLDAYLSSRNGGAA